MTERKHKRAKFKRRTLLVLATLFLLAVGGWFFLKSYVANKFQTQLLELGLGKPAIRRISISTSGVTAHGIKFATNNTDGPWLEIQRVAIKHPIWRLVRGDNSYQQIDVEKVTAVLEDSGQAASELTGAFDISQFELPADTIKLTNSAIVFRKSGHADFTVDGIDGSIVKSENGASFTGQFSNMAGGNWEVEGNLDANKKAYEADLSSKNIRLVDGQWQQWPGIIESLPNYVRADADASVEFSVSGDPRKPFSYRANIAIQQARLNFPLFDLPLSIKSGNAVIEDGMVTYQKIEATVDGKDRFFASGTTTIDKFPLKSEFKGSFKDVDISSLRKLVPDVPDLVSGRTSGEFSGSVDVENSTRTTLAISSTVTGQNSTYGKIKAETLTAQVEVQPLIIDSLQNQETLGGSFVITATMKNQSANDIFSTFELDGLSRQLEIDTNGSGNFRLDLPLATAADLETWKMAISSTSATGSINQQPIRDLKIDASLDSGNLIFSRISAVPFTKNQPVILAQGKHPLNISGSRLDVTLDWPLTRSTPRVDTGQIKIDGKLPAPWLIELVRRQALLASTTTDSDSVDELESFLDRIRGTANVSLDLSVDADEAISMQSWSGAGNFTNTSLALNENSLDEVTAHLTLNKGVLSIENLIGNFSDGGQITGDGTIDIVDGNSHSVSLSTRDLPLKWVASIARETSPSASALFETVGINPNSLEGELVADINFRSDLENENQPWHLKTAISSKQFDIKGQSLQDVQLTGILDSTQLRITNAKARAHSSGEGQITIGADWQFKNESGQADLAWDKLPVGWLAGFFQTGENAIGGSTSGKLHFTKTNSQQTSSLLPSTVAGKFSIDKLAGLNSAPIGFDVRTENGNVLWKHSSVENDDLKMELAGNIGLNEPFPFQVDGLIKSTELSRLIEHLAISESKRDQMAVRGIVDAKLEFQGNVSPWNWNSTGELKIAEPKIGKRQFSDVIANWNHRNDNWSQSTGTLQALGGKLELIELEESPQKMRIQVSDLDSNELNLLADLPVQITGGLNGEATIYDWTLPKSSLAYVNFDGISMDIGLAELSELNGKFEYRQRRLYYKIDGQMLGGQLASSGETRLDENSLYSTQFPLQARLTGGSLTRLFGDSERFRSLRPMAGRVSANAGLVFHLDRSPEGQGKIQVDDMRWDQEFITREISSIVNISDDILRLEGLRADMRSGAISGSARIPLASSAAGSYQLNVRHLDLKRLLDVVLEKPVEATGLFDARITGQFGNVISGQGTVGVSRARILGMAAQNISLPVLFKFQTEESSGRIEFRRSRFQLFDGTVSGHANVDFGRQFNLETDLKVSNLDTEQLFAFVRGRQGHGSLSGGLKMNGRAIRSSNDLNGSFKGRLNRAEAFKLPVLTDLARFIGVTQLNTQNFDSDEIDLRLNRGRIDVRKLNLSNPLAQIAIGGHAFLDGRLNLTVAGRIEKLNEPTLLDQLAGSPLARFQGPTVALIAQAAEFLSNRLVFVKIAGSFRQPQFRLDTGQQIREETIRYFLRGSQILPFADRPIK